MGTVGGIGESPGWFMLKHGIYPMVGAVAAFVLVIVLAWIWMSIFTLFATRRKS